MPQSLHALGPIRVLMVEDSPEDAELTSMQLLDAGLEAQFERVESADGVERAMEKFKPDLVLSDLSMPGFSGHEALRLVQALAPRTPFIFLSGTMGEETAVQALRDGAVDYVLKHNPARLPAAAARAVREARGEAERERAEQELLRAQRLDSLAMLAAGLSHDLRNILQPLLVIPDLLVGHSDDPRVRRLADMVGECGRRGCEMAESMLSFVRGSRAASREVPLASLFQAVQLLLQSSLPRGARLEVEPAADSLVVQANHTELQQCLLNLCINALQAMPDGGTLRLAAGEVEEAGVRLARIEVSDTGTGMDEASLAQLFTPFFTTRREGTGLGLVSCKRIVESHGGRIDVRSRRGKGTTFELLLPLQGEGAAAARDALPALEGRGRRVLVVDSDATRLSLVGNALGSQGFEPAMAADGAIALGSLSQAMPALVVIDNDMHLISAPSLLLAMRGRGYAGPVLVLEDPARPLDRAQWPQGLALQVLPKPLEMRRVFAAVEQALQSVAPAG
jgi:signal transduction histidine kinase